MIITIAEPSELKLIEEITGGHSWSGRIIITGVGMMTTIRALKDVDGNATILNLGYAGTNSLEVGKCYQVSSVATHHNLGTLRHGRE